MQQIIRLNKGPYLLLLRICRILSCSCDVVWYCNVQYVFVLFPERKHGINILWCDKMVFKEDRIASGQYFPEILSGFCLLWILHCSIMIDEGCISHLLGFKWVVQLWHWKEALSLPIYCIEAKKLKLFKVEYAVLLQDVWLLMISVISWFFFLSLTKISLRYDYQNRTYLWIHDLEKK